MVRLLSCTARLLPVLTLLASGTSLAQPTITPDAPVMKLDEIGLYSVGWAYRGHSEQTFPLGWSGPFDDRTGVACEPAGEQNGREAFLLHCPWRGGTGFAFQQFVFALPKVRSIRMRGATAMRADAVGKSDGATFRIYVNGRKLLDVNRTDAAWRAFNLDLTPYAGRTAVIRFETDPGPQDNPSFDFSLWGERELVLQGYRPKTISHPASPPLPLSAVSSRRARTVAPTSGFPTAHSVGLTGDVAIFRSSGPDGTLEYRWRRPKSPTDPFLGSLVLRARMRGDAPVEVPLAQDARLTWVTSATLRSSRWVAGRNRISCISTYDTPSGRATLAATGALSDKSLVLGVSCDRPLIRELYAGSWGPVLRRRPVAVPYYSGQVHFLPAQNLFVNAFLDWTASSASSHNGTRATYGALTDGSRVPLKESVVYAAAWHLAEVLPNIPNPPSPYIAAVGGRIVLDNWGGSFTSIADSFRRLADYGIRDCIALIHVWQRSGYDNALPAHYPAAASQGGDAGMRKLVSTGVGLGYKIALHENYVDYYPNYEGFTESDIALDSDGSRQKAWYNSGTGIQSFAVRPNAILRLAEGQSPEIHRRYGTNACYLDVHSAVPPWFHVDFRAGEQGAGTFRRVWDVHRALWQYERTTHHGPVFGEGNNHWYWSGCLDGVEAQFGVGWPANQGMSAPLMVDFDLLKIHPLQVNHGMGYYERWWNRPRWGALPPMVVLDQYRMQEVAYGHAGFLGGSTWSVLPLAWLEHNLLTPVTARYAGVPPSRILYQVNGRWVDGTAAAKAGAWHRVRVTYANGLEVVANDDAASLTVGGYTLGRFGWLARGAGVTAYTALRHGVVADYAETADSVFANARNAADWSITGLRRIRPEVASFRQTAPRTFSATYRWTVNDRLPLNYNCFVHFVDPNREGEGIVFQQDHPLAKPTSAWAPGQTVSDGPYAITVPADVPDGQYAWTIGLWSPDEGGRVSLQGVEDGHGRIRLGVLQVRGEEVRFVPERITGDARLRLYEANLNLRGLVVDFRTLRTNGSVMIRRQGRQWVLQTFPRNRQFVLELSQRRFGRPRSVACEGGPSRTVTPVPARSGYWRLPLTGAREYRWAAG